MRSPSKMKWLGAVLAAATASPSFPGPIGDHVLPEISQEVLNQVADTLQVKYRLISNQPQNCPGEPEFCYHARLELTSPVDVKADGWNIMFGQVYPSLAVKSDVFKLTHINGDLNRLEPAENFAGFVAGEPQTIDLWVASSLLNEGELFPNYVLSAQGLEPRVIKSTQIYLDAETQLEVKPYAQVSGAPAIMTSHKDDDYADYSPAALYDQYQSDSYPLSQVAKAIVPTPAKVQYFADGADIDLSGGIALSLSNLEEADLAAALARLEKLGVAQNKRGVPLQISVSEMADGSEYALDTRGGRVSIRAASATGAFYGLQSLISLLSLDSMTVPTVAVSDKPRYDYRGLHLDVARNFHSKALVLQLLENMAAYKLNALHLHLADDEGWRIEIPGLPELTALSSRRCISLEDEICLQPQLGGAISSGRDGYFSTADYIEILRAAKAQHIEVIPSLDMPGHSRAAVKAMELRYRRLMAEGKPLEAKAYLLSDLDDKTEYSSIQSYNDNTLNACMDSTFAFVDKVVGEVAELHQKAGTPLHTYHIGADETAGAWVKSPLCKAFLADNDHGVHEVEQLTGYFIQRVSQNLAGQGIEVAGWNDGLSETDPEKMPGNVTSYMWATLPDGAHKAVSDHARRGWDIVLSTPDVTYLDFPYEKDPRESGYKWGSRRTNSRTIFDFMPDNLPANAEVRKDVIGRDYVADDRVQRDEEGSVIHQPLPAGFQVKGIQGQLWSEVVRQDHLVGYMLFPRLIALAERAWHRGGWELPYDYQGKKYSAETTYFTAERKTQRDRAWRDFINAVGRKELRKLDQIGTFYRIPNVVTKVVDNRLHAATLIPGLPIQYRVDGREWKSYSEPLTVDGKNKIEFRALSADGRRPGRIDMASLDEENR